MNLAAIHVSHEQLYRVGSDVNNSPPGVCHSGIRAVHTAQPKLKRCNALFTGYSQASQARVLLANWRKMTKTGFPGASVILAHVNKPSPNCNFSTEVASTTIRGYLVLF